MPAAANAVCAPPPQGNVQVDQEGNPLYDSYNALASDRNNYAKDFSDTSPDVSVP